MDWASSGNALQTGRQRLATHVCRGHSLATVGIDVLCKKLLETCAPQVTLSNLWKFSVRLSTRAMSMPRSMSSVMERRSTSPLAHKEQRTRLKRGGLDTTKRGSPSFKGHSSSVMLKMTQGISTVTLASSLPTPSTSSRQCLSWWAMLPLRWGAI